MNHYEELDDSLRSEFGAKPELADASFFFTALRKLAADPDLVEHAEGVATGQEPTPDEAAAHTQAGKPDTTGHLEGEFAVSPEDVAMQLAQIVSNSMRQHGAYAYYGEVMRGLGRGELSELFDAQGRDEIKEMKYFLRRLGVLIPGGVPIPVAPTPEPTADPIAALNFLIAGEQQAIVLFKTLHSMLGDNPMKFTLEQFQSDAQEHLDKLWQYMPEKTTKKSSADKLAAARRKLAAPKAPTQQPGDVVVPEAGTEPVEQYLTRDLMLSHAQATAENQALKQNLEQTQQQMVQQGQQIESLGAENQAVQQQAAATAEQAQVLGQQAQQASQEAASATAQAASEADAKMRLSMRINQMRQMLADTVSSDPVAEEGVDTTPLMTPEQQAQEQEAAAVEEQNAAAQTGGPKAKKETEQAQRAQQEAAQQTQQAEQAKSASVLDRAKDKATQVLEAAGAATARGAASQAGPAGGAAGKALAEHAPEVGRGMGRGIAEYGAEAGGRLVEGASEKMRAAIRSNKGRAAIVGAAAIGGAKAYQQHKRDKNQKRIADALERIAKKE
jgi:rubrerythrin